MSETTWLTPAAQAKLRDELAHLTTEGRRAIEQRISEARDHGDLRENAEYDTAKNDQGLMEARIRQIKHILENSEVREAEDSGRVEVGTIATVVDEDGDEMDYFIAAAENKLPGMILASPTSPVGSALLGAAPGVGLDFVLDVADVEDQGVEASSGPAAHEFTTAVARIVVIGAGGAGGIVEAGLVARSRRVIGGVGVAGGAGCGAPGIGSRIPSSRAAVAASDKTQGEAEGC